MIRPILWRCSCISTRRTQSYRTLSPEPGLCLRGPRRKMSSAEEDARDPPPGFSLPGPWFDISSVISTFGETGACFSYAPPLTREF